MTNALPAEEGRAWVALGVPADAPACAAGLSAPENSWSFATDFALDLRTLPDGGEGSYVDAYACYEGGDQPFADAVTSALAKQAGVGVASYQGEGITCLGPQRVYFREYPDWRLDGTSVTAISTTEHIVLRHAVQKGGSADLSLDCAVDSTLDVEWSLYYGSQAEPDMEQPITVQILASGETTYFWLVSGAVSAEVPAGPNEVRTTLTNAAPAEEQTAFDTVWVGDWVAPPGAVANPFLPLIMR